jgi:hypothetical protein
MVKGSIFWCPLCDKLIRYQENCPDCLADGEKIGWMETWQAAEL